MSNNGLCAKCYHGEVGGCCTVSEDLAPGTHPITWNDAKRISDHTGLSMEAVARVVPLTAGVLGDLAVYSPLYPVACVAGGVLTLPLVKYQGPPRATGKDHRCAYLDPESGCVLPRKVRPTHCLLYPLTVFPDYAGLRLVVNEAYRGTCLLISSSDSLTDLQRLCGIESMDEMKRILKQLTDDLKDHPNHTTEIQSLLNRKE